MTCDAPPRQCLEWHVLPRLDGATLNAARDSISARCPVHPDRKQSFGISVGENKRLVWGCLRKPPCPGERIRAVLIQRGVPNACLPRSVKDRDELLDRIQQATYADSADHAVIRLHVAALLEGHYNGLPRGEELERIAGLAKVSRAAAYEARKTGLPSNHNPSCYPNPENVVKPRRSQPREKSSQWT